jgi:hypothetical protein
MSRISFADDLSSDDTQTNFSLFECRRNVATDLARALDALVGVFRFETDVGRREALLVAVDVAVVQAGHAGRRRTAAEIRGRERRHWNFLRVERSRTRRSRRQSRRRFRGLF